jgi:PAS domain S-box-containing protein
LGVGSTLETSRVADEIRGAINASAMEGALAKSLTNGGYFSPRTLEYLTTLLNTQRRERWLILTIVVFSGLLALAILEADRIRRQRNRITVAETALRQGEQKLRLMANNLSEMVLAYDMDRRLVFVNPAVEQLTGYSVAALENDRSICWVHPEERSRMLAHWDNVFRGGSFKDEEYRLITKNGTLKWAAAAWDLSMTKRGARSESNAASATSPNASSPNKPCGNPSEDFGSFWKAFNSSPS